MPDIRKHRGAHPEDRKLFADDQLPVLRTAVRELSWLLNRDYSIKGALKLVGDRHALTDRQRLAVSRAACSDQSKEQRAAARLTAEAVAGMEIILDGFNLIITIEAALSGGLLIQCRDGCIRDLATENGWNWTVEVLFNPDAEIIISGRLVISSDSHILDKTDHWINFNRYLLDERLKKFWLIDLSG